MFLEGLTAKRSTNRETSINNKGTKIDRLLSP